jgi:hypothetical protein
MEKHYATWQLLSYLYNLNQHKLKGDENILHTSFTGIISICLGEKEIRYFPVFFHNSHFSILLIKYETAIILFHPSQTLWVLCFIS